MSRDGGPLADLLYGGETLETEAAVGTTRIGVTSHRVLVLSPDGDGPRFRAADRPNVTGVAVATAGSGNDVFRSIKLGVYAAVLLGGGLLLDLDALIPTVDPGTAGAFGGIVSVVSGLQRALGLVDEVMLASGAVFLAAALAFAAKYLHGRTRYLEIRVAGDDPIRIPVAGPDPPVVDRLAAAVGQSS